MDKVYELKVKCSKCGSIVGTGFWTDKRTFESSILIDNKTECPNCQTTITWSKEDVCTQESKQSG